MDAEWYIRCGTCGKISYVGSVPISYCPLCGSPCVEAEEYEEGE